LSSLGKAFSLATKLRGWKKEHNEAKRKEIEKALHSLIKAARETRLCLAQQRDAKAPPMSKPDVADLWAKAAQDMWNLDPEAGQLFTLKMEYWLDPQ
jgi:hypothetical protein